MNYHISMIKLMMRIEQCMSEDSSAEDFIRLWEELPETANRIINPPINDSFFAASWVWIDNERMIEDLALKYISAFAERYPEELLKQDLSGMEIYVIRTIHRDIYQGKRTAELLMKKLSEGAARIWKNVFPKVLFSAILSDNLSSLDFLLSLPEKPIDYITLDVYSYLSDGGRYDLLDRIFAGASRDEMLAILNKFPSFMDIMSQRPDIEYIYEAAGYIEGCNSSDERAEIVNGLIEEMNVSITFRYSLKEQIEKYIDSGDCFIVRSWRFMKEHGLKFHDLKFFINFESMLTNRKENEIFFSLMKEYLVPVLDDKVYITVRYYLMLEDDHRNMFLKLVDIIGGSRVVLDCREYQDELCFSEDAPEVSLLKLLKKSPDVIISEDLKNSGFTLLLLDSSDVLKYMLNSGRLTDEQIDSLIYMCAEKRRPDPLNVIRKYKNRHKK